MIEQWQVEAGPHNAWFIYAPGKRYIGTAHNSRDAHLMASIPTFLNLINALLEDRGMDDDELAQSARRLVSAATDEPGSL